MKKLFITLAATFMIAATGWAQNSVPAAKIMTEEEVNAKLEPFFKSLEAIPQDGNENEKVKAAALVFVKENPNAAGSYVLRSVLPYVMSIEEVVKIADENEYFKNDRAIIDQKKNWSIQIETGEGKMFKDFSATYDGKETKLSDYVGKGKYVLVDFWASW